MAPEREPKQEPDKEKEGAVSELDSPRNAGSMADADGFAEITGPCGDTMRIWLKVTDGSLAAVTGTTDGCGNAIACCSMVTELARGRSIAEALQINQQAILSALGGLPQEGEHCALLAENTLKAAIREYLALRKEPWKKAYRRR